jgi:hypothetical protein
MGQLAISDTNPHTIFTGRSCRAFWVRNRAGAGNGDVLYNIPSLDQDTGIAISPGDPGLVRAGARINTVIVTAPGGQATVDYGIVVE